jgi:glycosyltransferase involved in cell wall biosynthesis
MRFLFVIDSLGSGGAQRQMVSLATELARRGYRIELFVYAGSDFFAPSLRAAGITVHVHPKPWKLSSATVRTLARLMKTGRYDVVLSFLGTPNLYSILARMAVPRPPALVVSERSCVLPGVRGVRNRLIARLYPFVDRVTVNSHHLREHYEGKYRWARGRVVTIWNGIDLDSFSPRPFTPRCPLRLLAIGNMAPNKNWHRLAEALALLRDRHGVVAHVSLVSACNALSKRNLRYYERLRGIVGARGLSSQWAWLGQRSDIVDLLAEHHALVHPSYREGLPNVVCEALACGRPVLVSGMLDHPRLVQDGETGFLVDAMNGQDQADAMLRLSRLSDEQLIDMGAAARRFAEVNLSIARMADAYERLFLSLAKREASAGDTVTQPSN